MTIAPARGGYRLLTTEQMLAYLRTNVLVKDECLIWSGADKRTPIVMWNWKRYSARRLLVELAGKQLRPRQVVYTTCGSPHCMNEAHLRIGSRAQMMRSKGGQGLLHGGTTHALAIARGRAQGARMPMTERHNVARMRADGWTWKRIAAHYGVHLSCPQKQLQKWEVLFGPSAYWTAPERKAA